MGNLKLQSSQRQKPATQTQRPAQKSAQSVLFTHKVEGLTSPKWMHMNGQCCAILATPEENASLFTNWKASAYQVQLIRTGETPFLPAKFIVADNDEEPR